MENTNGEKQRIPTDKLVFGVLLVVAGLLMFGAQINLWNMRDFWRLWPLFLIFLGLVSEIDALRSRKSDGGMFLLGVGTWMLVGTNQWFGLSVGTAMPIGVVIVGALMVVHAIVDKPEVKEKNDEYK